MTKAKSDSSERIFKIGNRKCYLTDGLNEWPIYSSDKVGDIEIYRTPSKLVTTNRALLASMCTKLEKQYSDYLSRNVSPRTMGEEPMHRSKVPRKFEKKGSIHPLHPDYPTVEDGVLPDRLATRFTL